MHGGFAEDAQTARHSRVAGLHLTSSRRREDGLSNADKLAHYVFLIGEINVNVYSEEARQMIPPHPAPSLPGSLEAGLNASLACMLSISFYFTAAMNTSPNNKEAVQRR